MFIFHGLMKLGKEFVMSVFLTTMVLNKFHLDINLLLDIRVNHCEGECDIRVRVYIR